MIRDLFPSYIDGLTSEASNRAVEEHAAGCEECRKLLATMKGGGEAFAPEETGKKEIDYLKKNRRRTFMIVLFSILGVLALSVLVVALRFFVIGDKGRENEFVWTAEVDSKTLKWKAYTREHSAVKVGNVRFEEQDGVVTIYANCVLVSPTRVESYTKEGIYTASQEIRRVQAGGCVLWDDGTTLSQLASSAWQSRHEYIGDAPANIRTFLALSVDEVFGHCEHYLYTKEAPYEWMLKVISDIPSSEMPKPEEEMKKAAFMMLALIRNLDRVTFSYTLDGILTTCSFTTEDADAFFGQSIKACMESPRLTDELLKKTGWYETVMARLLSSDTPWWLNEPHAR